MVRLLKQIFKFGVVGFSAFLIDYGIMILLTEVFSVNYLVSSAISFCVSVVYNYLLSIFWVFDVQKSKGAQNFIVFLVLSVIGLLLNQVLMWLGTDILAVHYMLTKIAATVVVMVYNFITRKLFLEKK